jgi:hypothetical protein
MRQRFFHILFLVTALAFSIHASAQKAIFDKYEDTNGVTTIYISKTMLGMIPNVKAGKHDIGNIASKLDYIRILSCEKPALFSKLIDEARKTYRSGNYETIMKMNDDGEKMTIYQRTLKDGKNEFALLTEDKDEVTIINLMGAITLKDIKDIAGQH